MDGRDLRLDEDAIAAITDLHGHIEPGLLADFEDDLLRFESIETAFRGDGVCAGRQLIDAISAFCVDNSGTDEAGLVLPDLTVTSGWSARLILNFAEKYGGRNLGISRGSWRAGILLSKAVSSWNYGLQDLDCVVEMAISQSMDPAGKKGLMVCGVVEDGRIPIGAVVLH